MGKTNPEGSDRCLFYPLYGRLKKFEAVTGCWPVYGLNDQHAVHATEFVRLLAISAWFVHPFRFVYTIFEFVLAVFGQGHFAAERTVFFLAHYNRVFPIAVQAENFYGFSVFYLKGEFYLAVALCLEIRFLYHDDNNFD